MSEFVEYVKEVFVHFGTVEARKMFGGHGLYFRDIMFALIADETLYLKVDPELAQDFEAKALEPFVYEKGDTVVKMSYYEAPHEIFDDPDQAAEWARRSYEVALLSKSKRKRRSRK